MSLSPSKKRECVDLLLATEEGQIICCNTLDSIADKVIGESDVSDLYDWWFNLFFFVGGSSSDAKNRLVRLLTTVVFYDSPPNFRAGTAKPNWLVRCRHAVDNSVHDGYFCTVMLTTVFEDIVENSSRLQASGTLSRTTQRGNKPRRSRARTPTQTVLLKQPLGLTSGKPRNVAWLCPQPSLQDCRSSLNVRDILGLIHYKPDNELTVVYIPAERVESTERGRPSFADAGTHPRFRCAPDSQSAVRRTSWGHTVNLRSLRHAEPSCDGAPELVFEPVDHQRLGRVAVEFLPRLGSPVKTETTNAQFVDRLLRGRSLDKLREELLGKI